VAESGGVQLQGQIDGIGRGVVHGWACQVGPANGATVAAGTYTRPLFSSTSAVLVTPPHVPLSNRLGENHAPNVFHKMCLRSAKKWTSVSP